MVDTYTPSLRIVQMPTGSNNGLWGDKADDALKFLEQAIAGSTAISLTASDHTLTTANNASDEARNMVISFTGTPGTPRTVTVPDVSKLTLMVNTTDSNVICSAGAGNKPTLLPNQVAFVLTDGGTNAFAFVIADVVGKGVLPQLFAPLSL